MSPPAVLHATASLPSSGAWGRPPGGAHRAKDAPVNATKEKLTVGGHPVYAAYFEGGMGYRIDITKGVAKGNEPETLCKRTAPVFRRLLLRRKPQRKRCAQTRSSAASTATAGAASTTATRSPTTSTLSLIHI